MSRSVCLFDYKFNVNVDEVLTLAPKFFLYTDYKISFLRYHTISVTV